MEAAVLSLAEMSGRYEGTPHTYRAVRLGSRRTCCVGQGGA
jgi:hypothetical protein